MIYYFMYRVCWNDYKSSGYVSQFAINGKCDERLFSFFFSFSNLPKHIKWKIRAWNFNNSGQYFLLCCCVMWMNGETVGPNLDGLAEYIAWVDSSPFFFYNVTVCVSPVYCDSRLIFFFQDFNFRMASFQDRRMCDWSNERISHKSFIHKRKRNKARITYSTYNLILMHFIKKKKKIYI